MDNNNIRNNNNKNYNDNNDQQDIHRQFHGYKNIPMIWLSYADHSNHDDADADDDGNYIQQYLPALFNLCGTILDPTPLLVAAIPLDILSISSRLGRENLLSLAM